MIGDKLIIDEYHHAAADMVVAYLDKQKPDMPYSISISGESGSGKSEIAKVLMESLVARGNKVLVLGQDDYFKLPPHSNHQHRNKDISWVGPREVKLDLMHNHTQKLFSNNGEMVVKPLVHFAQDKIGTENLAGPYDIVIAEGTYTSLLENISFRVFIDRDYHETKKHRLSRNRDQALEDNEDQDLKFLEKVLEIEHKIISKHKNLADLVIPPPQVLLKTK